jgi:ribonucleotide reductase alpha subunit
LATPFGPTGEAVYRRTYSRVKPDGNYETWPETVARVARGNLSLVYGHQSTWSKEVWKEYDSLNYYMGNMAILPAGRQLWASGVEGRQFLFNCHVSGWGQKFSDHFAFTFMRLVEGGGVGANYSTRLFEHYGYPKHPINLILAADETHTDYEKMREYLASSDVFDKEVAHAARHYSDGVCLVEDTREGWAVALSHVIDEAMSIYGKADRPVSIFLDLSKIRPEGSPLVSSGGVASGPAPLAKMLHDIVSVLNRAWSVGHFSPVDIMEMDHVISVGAIAGGKRRSARMSMCHWDDPYIIDFINAKADGSKFWTTNISVEIDNEFLAALDDQTGNVAWARQVHKAVCEAVLKNGEPGYWNSDLSNEGEPGTIIATNPCLTGDTVIATIDGPRTFKDLAEVGEDVQVYSWHPKTKKPVVRWMRQPRLTRKNTEILKVTFDSGLEVRCTPDHNFFSFRGEKVQAQHLREGQSIRAFSASRDSSGHERIHGWDSDRNAANHQWTHRMLWENFLGTELPDGINVAHIDGDGTNNGMDNLALMTELGHRRYDMPLRQQNGMDGHSPNHKVVSVEPAGRADVYNGTVDDSHAYIVLDPEPIAGHMSGVMSANCGEIPLEAWEACNLGHVNLDWFVNKEVACGFDPQLLLEAHRLVTRFLVRSTFGDITDPKQKVIQDRNRRIGVGHMGVQGFFAKAYELKYSEIAKQRDNGIVSPQGLLRHLYHTVRQEANDYAVELRIPAPVKVTTVAPTGSVSKLPGVSEGIQAIYARWFIQRVRFSLRDDREFEQVQAFQQQGFKVETDVYDESGMTAVVCFPTENLLVSQVRALGLDVDLVESAEQVSIEDMLELQAFYQKHWADNAISYTANVPEGTVTPEALDGILRAYLPKLKGTTIMVDATRDQAPYTRISEAAYQVAEATRTSDSISEECASGACPIR